MPTEPRKDFLVMVHSQTDNQQLKIKCNVEQALAIAINRSIFPTHDITVVHASGDVFSTADLRAFANNESSFSAVQRLASCKNCANTAMSLLGLGGTGEVACPICAGSGVEVGGLLCEGCRGDGRVICKDCDGSGFRLG